MITLTNQQARQFMLLKHGLLDAHKFTGKQGMLEYVRQTGCIQYDPVDACGKNSELVGQSRVKGFTKNMLFELLYTDRQLVDYVDKNLSIFPVEDWPYFERYRQASRNQEARYPETCALKEQVYRYIETHGAICSDDLRLEGNQFWFSAIHWSGGTNQTRSVLEQMYSTGELIVHHKKGTRKYYDIAAKYLPEALLQAPDPLPDDAAHRKWRVSRRIGAVGLLWNRASDAWLGIWGLKTAERNDAFQQLLEEEKIIEVSVEGIKAVLYAIASDYPLFETVSQNPGFKPRCEVIAPLDCFMWDRKLIKAVFDFDYTWEIYTPEAKRKYGYYVLPLLYGERFIGRVEAAAERKTGTLIVKNIWYENGVKQTQKIQQALDKCMERLARLNDCQTIDRLIGYKKS